MMLHNAIKDGDFERVKYLLSAGVPLNSKTDERCTIELVKLLVATGLNTTSPCAQTSLLIASSNLDRESSPDEFDYFNPAVQDGDKSRAALYDSFRAEEYKREEIYRFLLSKTPENDYYQLPGVFMNTNVPLAIRKDALEKYLAHPQVAINEKTQPFYKAKGEASEFWPLHFKVLSEKFVDSAIAYNSKIQSIRLNIENSTESRMKTLELPELSVTSLMEGQVSYEESARSAFHYYGYVRAVGYVDRSNFRDIHKLNSEIAIITMIVNSGKVDLNSKDRLGNTILNQIIARYSTAYANNKRVRPLAVLSRYLINKGADSGLKDKGGDSAAMVVQRQYLMDGGGWTELLRAFKDPSYN
ncbi:hypothetical protein L539_4777 [Bordetella hinzii 5132]|nr:hypothetical protein L539_4777 [Bordetella hinzii 5132]